MAYGGVLQGEDVIRRKFTTQRLPPLKNWAKCVALLPHRLPAFRVLPRLLHLLVETRPVAPIQLISPTHRHDMDLIAVITG